MGRIEPFLVAGASLVGAPFTVACGPKSCTNPAEEGRVSGTVSHVGSQGTTFTQPQSGQAGDLSLGGGTAWVYGLFTDEAGVQRGYSIEIPGVSTGVTLDLARGAQICVSPEPSYPATVCSSVSGSMSVRSYAEDCQDPGYCIESIDASASVNATWNSVPYDFELTLAETGEWVPAQCPGPG
jgi:hypothetical protein